MVGEGGVKIWWKGIYWGGEIFLDGGGGLRKLLASGGTLPSPPSPPLGKTLTIKNDQILLYFRFNKIIKEPGTSLQSPALNQKYVRKVFYIVQQYLTKFRFDSTYDSKEISVTVTFTM